MENQEKKSELKLALITIAVNLFMAVKGFISAEMFAYISGGLSALYILARSVVKITPTKKDDEKLEKIAEMLEKAGIKLPK